MSFCDHQNYFWQFFDLFNSNLNLNKIFKRQRIYLFRKLFSCLSLKFGVIFIFYLAVLYFLISNWKVLKSYEIYKIFFVYFDKVNSIYIFSDLPWPEEWRSGLPIQESPKLYKIRIQRLYPLQRNKTIS